MKDNPYRFCDRRYDRCHVECEAYKSFSIRRKEEIEKLRTENSIARMIDGRQRWKRELFKKKARTPKNL